MNPAWLVSIIGFVVLEGLSSMAGRRFDAAATAGLNAIVRWYRRGRRPVNDDLRRATEVAYLRAQQQIASESLNQDALDAEARTWLKRKRESLAEEIRLIRKAKVVRSPPSGIESPLLMIHDMQGLEQHVDAFGRRLVEAACDDHPPDPFRTRASAELLHLTCEFFVDELKRNNAARVVFEGEILATVQQVLAKQDVSIAKLEAAINDLAGQRLAAGEAILAEATSSEHRIVGRPHILSWLLREHSFFDNWLADYGVEESHLSACMDQLLAHQPTGERTRPTGSFTRIIARAQQIKAALSMRPEVDCVWMALSEDTSQVSLERREPPNRWLSFIESIPGLLSAMRVDTPYAS